MAFQQCAQFQQSARGDLFGTLAGLTFVRIGRRGKKRRQQQRRIGLAVQRHIAHGQRAQRFPVIAAG